MGHRFADKALLRRALTHASAAAFQSNERLEFLGDRVLGLIVAERLYTMYPDEQEGFLTMKLHALCRREACARAAETAGLPADIILERGAAESGGRANKIILADACEAVIAALYVDGGYDAARRFVERAWDEQFSSLDRETRDAKTLLQEWSQARAGNPMPTYEIVGREGPAHAPQFRVRVQVEGFKPQEGEGTSKREAEQNAASSMLSAVGWVPR